jgi:hypothetical protein
VGSFAGGTFSSGAYQALEDLEGGLEDEGLGIVVGGGLLSPRSAAAAAVPLNPVLEELEPEEEPEKGEFQIVFICFCALLGFLLMGHFQYQAPPGLWEIV